MTGISAIRSALSSASASQQAIFALACAERTAIVFNRLAAPASMAVYKAVLDVAWDAVKTGTRIATERRQSLASLPEATIDDSHRRKFYATLAMGVLEHALDVMDTSGTQEAADLACCQSLDLYSCFDAIVQGTPSTIVDPANPPPSGPLELAEIAEQIEILRALTIGSEVGAAFCDQLRERAKSASQILDSAITTLFKGRN